MKKTVTLIALILCFLASKAQPPTINIKYDENGNRIMRYKTGNKPAPPTNNDNKEVLTPTEVTTKNGISAITTASFQVYPNPSNDNFNVAIDAAILNASCEITLTDQLGRVHYQQKAKTALTTISTAHLADGVYYIILNYSGKKSTVKLVKEVSQ